MKKCPDCGYSHDAPTERCDNCHDAWRGYKDVDFTSVHQWARENECAGTMFSPADVETIWEMEWEEELGIPFKDVWNQLRNAWEWDKGLQELLTERGFGIISQMCAEFVREKGLRNDLS